MATREKGGGVTPSPSGAERELRLVQSLIANDAYAATLIKALGAQACAIIESKNVELLALRKRVYAAEDECARVQASMQFVRDLLVITEGQRDMLRAELTQAKLLKPRTGAAHE